MRAALIALIGMATLLAGALLGGESGARARGHDPAAPHLRYGLSYPAARHALIHQGFDPVVILDHGGDGSQCDETPKPSRCRRFPELDDCAGDAALCEFLFRSRRDGSYWSVQTEGDFDSTGGAAKLKCCLFGRAEADIGGYLVLDAQGRSFRLPRPRPRHWTCAPSSILGPCRSPFHGACSLSIPSAKACRDWRGAFEGLPNILGLTYPRARSAMARAGFDPEPVPTHTRNMLADCRYTDFTVCTAHPELMGCGGGVCDFLYRRRSDGKAVIVEGSEGSLESVRWPQPTDRQLYGAIVDTRVGSPPRGAADRSHPGDQAEPSAHER